MCPCQRILIDLLNCHPSGLNLITIDGLKPETVYEVKMSAINGKGEGESSSLDTFKTQPVRKCLSLRLFLSPSFNLLITWPQRTFYPSRPLLSAATDLTTHNASCPGPCQPCWISIPGDALLVLCVCCCVCMCLCLFNRPSVCLNTFLKVSPQCHHSFSPQPCFLVMRCCLHLSAGASMCQATAVSLVSTQSCALC